MASVPSGCSASRRCRQASSRASRLTRLQVAFIVPSPRRVVARIPRVPRLPVRGRHGWSVVNPALGRAIIDLFPAPERRIAMGIQQLGLTLGGFVAVLAGGWRLPAGGFVRLGGKLLHRTRGGGQSPRGRPAERRRRGGDRGRVTGGADRVRRAARPLGFERSAVGPVRPAGHGGDSRGGGGGLPPSTRECVSS